MLKKPFFYYERYIGRLKDVLFIADNDQFKKKLPSEYPLLRTACAHADLPCDCLWPDNFSDY